MLRSIAFTAVLATSLVSAHMQLQYPPPINSKFDPQTIESNIDYSYTSPLLSDGSNYPCKGYNTPSAYSSLGSVATLKAGSSFDVQFASGGAVHGGGSCQFSVSYDQGKTFAVIHSVIGGCPLQSTYSVPIPSSLPSATKATFAWTWFNLVGNREEYMNCAIVDIQGSSSSGSYTGPGLFRANTLGDTCITTEGVTPVFPNPGPSVSYAAGMSSSSPATVIDGCSYNQDTSVTVGPSGSSSGGSGSGSSSSATPSKASTTTSRASTSTSKVATTSTKVAATTTKPAATTSYAPTTSAAAEPTAGPVPVGNFGVSRLSAARASASSRAAALSSASAAAATTSRAATTTTSRAASTTTSKAPAPTTTSKAPAPTTTSKVAATSSQSAATSSRTTSSAPPAATTSTGSSTSDGDTSGGTWLLCTSKTTFSLCSAAGCTAMGSVAPGTECLKGGIVMAGSVRKRMARVVVKRDVDTDASAPAERISAHASARVRAGADVKARRAAVQRARAHVVRSSRGGAH